MLPLIVLNGASSAGKTSTALALLPLFGSGCIFTSLDHLLEHEQPFGWNPVLRPLRILAFQLTDGQLKLFKRLHRQVMSHIKAGHPVILETALMDQQALKDAAECFAPLDGWFIGMKPPLEVSEQWETARGDRPIGHARRHYDLIHMHGVYDLVLDPSVLSPADCAAAIEERIKGEPPHAFQQLRGC